MDEPTAVAIVVFVLVFSGTLFGLWLRPRMPAHHLGSESREVVQLGIGLVATMTALVLGLVTASAKDSFDAMDEGVKQAATEILALDRVLARYGPETEPVRTGLRAAVAHRLAMTWPSRGAAPLSTDPLEAAHGVERLAAAVRALQPRDDDQKWLQDRALDLSETLLETRWTLLEGQQSGVPVPFLAVVVLWLAITFAGFGLLAPRNATVVCTLLVCAISVATAVFLVLELDGPLSGLIRVSPEPLEQALAVLDR